MTFEDMAFIRGTALLGYSDLVAELGGDPVALLRRAQVPAHAVGDQDEFIDYRAVVAALESAASVTGTPDFGRQLALHQGIEVLGPVGIAAKTAGTVGAALAAIEQYMSVYSAAVAASIDPEMTRHNARLAWRLVGDRLPAHAQSAELSIGLTLRIFRLFTDATFVPIEVQFAHRPRGPIDAYERYFGSPVTFEQPTAGIVFSRAVLNRRLDADAAVHGVVRDYLNTIVVPTETQSTEPVLLLIRRMLPTGQLNRDLVAGQLALHPRTLQRQLAGHGTTFERLVDDVRRREAERYLTTTDLPLGQVAGVLGYTEQSALTRSCRRWFGASPSVVRRARGAIPPIR